MITIFNRQELYSTFRPEDHFRFTDILRQNGIEHYTKFGGRGAYFSGRRSHYSSGGNNGCIYTVYVRRADYEQAAHLIRK